MPVQTIATRAINLPVQTKAVIQAVGAGFTKQRADKITGSLGGARSVHMRIADLLDFVRAQLGLKMISTDGLADEMIYHLLAKVDGAPLAGEEHSYSQTGWGDQSCLRGGRQGTTFMVSRTHEWALAEGGEQFLECTSAQKAAAAQILAVPEQWDGRLRWPRLWEPPAAPPDSSAALGTPQADSAGTSNSAASGSSGPSAAFFGKKRARKVFEQDDVDKAAAAAAAAALEKLSTRLVARGYLDEDANKLIFRIPGGSSHQLFLKLRAGLRETPDQLEITHVSSQPPAYSAKAAAPVAYQVYDFDKGCALQSVVRKATIVVPEGHRLHDSYGLKEQPNMTAKLKYTPHQQAGAERVIPAEDLCFGDTIRHGEIQLAVRLQPDALDGSPADASPQPQASGASAT